MVSAAEPDFGSAVQELRLEFGPKLEVERLGPDVGVIRAASPDVSEVAAACQKRPLVFVRHLTVELARIARADARSPAGVASAVRSALESTRAPVKLALQSWNSGPGWTGYSSGELSVYLADDLAKRGYSVSRAHEETVLSCCVSPAGVSVGLNRAGTSLSDWPGGRVRLSAGKEQVSRAEFKLEELFQAFPVPLPAQGHVLDLGASPGGWTRILRQRGLTAWAVDPAELDPRIAADPGVHHIRTTAGDFLRSSNQRFDAAVNDMRMDPVASCQVMLELAGRLNARSLAVITLKTGAHRPLETVRRCLKVLSAKYEVLHARQLHHNRREVTVVARCAAAP